MTRDQTKLEQARLYRVGSGEIRELLNDWDPISGSPVDEYDCLIPQLYAMLASGANVDKVERYVTDELRTHFGVEPHASREQALASRLVQWAQARPFD